jgi:curli biogenesis system outer membrane secretion channel CsgG
MRSAILILIIVLLAGIAYAKKPRLAIIDFQYKAGSAQGSWVVGEGMADMLATALFKSGKFDVMERSKLQSVLEEQKLQMSGITTPESAVKVGKILGLQYIVIGSVNQFGQKAEQTKAFGVAVNNVTARVATDTRIVNVETGRIEGAENGVGEETSTGVSIENADLLPTDVAWGSTGFDETTIGKATKKCIDDLVNQFTKTFGNMPLEGKIIKVNPDSVYVNLGKDSGVVIGQIFDIMEKGEELIDPDSGESLGSEDKKVGSIKVTEIKDKYCIASIVEGNGKLKVNDIVLQKK